MEAGFSNEGFRFQSVTKKDGWGKISLQNYRKDEEKNKVPRDSLGKGG